MPVWTLKHTPAVGSPVTKTLEEWGLSSVTLNRLSLDAGGLSASMDGTAMDADCPFAFGEQVDLYLDDAKKFTGFMQAPRARVEGGAEGIDLEFSDPWFWLESAMAPFPKWIGGNAAAQLGYLATVMNLERAGTMQVATSGAAFTSTVIKKFQTKNITLAGVARHLMAHVPDAVTAWDFSTTPPTLRCTQRASGTVRNYALGGVSVSQQVRPRPDLRVKAVELYYTRDDDNGVEQVVGSDIATAAEGIITLRHFQKLQRGSDHPAQKEIQPLESQEIDHMSAEWWAKNGGLRQDADDIVVGAGTTREMDPDAPENAGAGGLSGCTRQIIKGGIPEWDPYNDGNHFRVVRVTGYLTLKNYNIPEDTTSGYTVEQRVIVLRLPCTDLAGPSYEREIQEGHHIDHEQPPGGGLAASLLAGLNPLQYEGSIVIQEDEVSQPVLPGDVVNITGGRAEWESMNAQVHAVVNNFSDGGTRIDFGPAKHLEPSDVFGLLRKMSTLPPVSEVEQPPILDDGETRHTKHPAAGVARPTAQSVAPREFKQKHDEWDFEWKAAALCKWEKESGRKLHLNPDTGFIGVEDDEGKRITLTLADGGVILIEDADDNKIKISLPDKSVKIEGSDGKYSELTNTQLTFVDGAKSCTLDIDSLNMVGSGGDTLDVSLAAGMEHTDTAGNELKASATNGVVLTDAGGNELALTAPDGVAHTGSGGDLAELSAAGGLSVSDGGGNIAEVTAADALAHSKSTGATAEMSAARMLITASGGAVASAAPEGGFSNVDGSNSAQLDAYGGVQLSDGSGTVDVAVIAGKAISHQETDLCDEEGGEPVTKTAHFLRSEAS